MKPTELEYRQLKEMDERLIRYKEAAWDKAGHGDPRGMFVMCLVFSIPVIGWALLLLFLLNELATKWFRMLSIVIKAVVLFTIKLIRR